MEKFTVMRTLEHLALVKICATLWSQGDVTPYIMLMPIPPHIKYIDDEENEITMEDKLTEKILQLPLPKSLSNKLSDFIKPLGLEMIKWRLFHVQNGVPMDVPNNICWTSQGTIDKKKTAEALIKDASLDITLRYKLSCLYCLQDDIPQLWNKMPEDCKKLFYNKQGPRHVCFTRKQEIAVFWTYDVKGELDKMDSIIKTKLCSRQRTPYQYAFEYAACDGNRAAVEYFLQKLTPMEKRESLIWTTVHVAKFRDKFLVSFDCCVDHDIDEIKNEYADVLCFLLSQQMTEELQNYVFPKCAYEILLCYLGWPWQSSFVAMAKRVMPFLDKKSFEDLLYVIADKVKAEWKDFDYRKLFGEFWQLGLESHKRYITYDYTYAFGLLNRLLKIKDKENIALVLNAGTTVEKELVFFCGGCKYICQSLALRHEWDLLKFFVGECMSSQDREIVKEKFKRYTDLKPNTEWNNLFELLDNHIFGVNKRKNMEENECPIKFLKNMEREKQKESK